jgi:hypothetical protein
MRSFLRVSGERNKFLLNNNLGVNFTGAGDFQLLNAARTPSFVPESLSVTVPAEQQTPRFTSDSFTNLDTQAFSLGTPGTFKPMTAEEINKVNTSWLDFTDAKFTGDIVQADIPNVYAKVENENKEAELKAQEEVKKFQENSDKQTQELLKMLMGLFEMFSGGGGMGAIANVAGASTGNATTPTATTAPTAPANTPTATTPAVVVA